MHGFVGLHIQKKQKLTLTVFGNVSGVLERKVRINFFLGGRGGLIEA